MFSMRVKLPSMVSVTLLVLCGWCIPFAAAQTSKSASHPSANVPSLRQPQSATSPRLAHGPVTPAEQVLKALVKTSGRRHSFSVPPSPSTGPIFVGALNYNSAGSSTIFVAAGDLNGDGKTDLILADQCANYNNCNTGAVSVLLGNGDGTFQAATAYSAGGMYPQSVAVADVNNDGKLDVITSSNCVNSSDCSNGSVSVLLGNGDGTLQAPVTYSSAGENAQSVTVADVNGDGKPDLLVGNVCSDGNCSNGSLSVLLGNGDGTFQPAVSYNSGGAGTLSLSTGDVNGDGKLDVVLANNCVSNNDCSSGSATVLLGNGDGTFQSATTYNTGGQQTQSVAVGDVNGDGKLDIVLANNCAGNNNCSSGSVSVLLGNGDATFQSAVSFNSGGVYATSVTLADLNGDGKADVLVANQTDMNGNWADGSVASVLFGNGDGTFQTAVPYASGDFSGRGIIATDVNGDGKSDVVIAESCVDNYNCTSGAASVFLNKGDGTLLAPLNYSPGAWYSISVAAADVNGDGKVDLLVADQCTSNSNCSNGSASVLLGNGDGTFQPAVIYNVDGQDSTSIAVSDVNGDGYPDLIIGNQCQNNSNCSSGSISVLLGNGDGTFQAGTDYSSGGLYVYSVAVGDVNGDGKPDLILGNECADGNCSNGSVSVLLNNGDGTFSAPVTLSSGGLYAFSVSVADLNGDGKADIVVANQCTDNNCITGNTGVLLSNGDGTFQPVVSYPSGGLYSYATAIGDINGDGKADLVIASQCTDQNCTSGVISTLLGNGDGTFQSAVANTSPVLGGLQSIVLGDFNGDHKLDVAAPAGNILLLGNGDGTFQTPIALGARGEGIAAGDFNGDGRPDLAVGAATVLLNVSGGFVLPTTTVVVSSTNPSAFGASVTFTATVTGPGGTPTGTVTFSDGSTTLSQVTLASGAASYSTSSLAIGSHSITVSYSGDSGFAASTSTALSQSVQKADTATSLSAPANANVNQNVTLTTTVTPATSGAPTGAVTFFDGANQIGSSNLNGSGGASLSTSTLAAGSHSITAVYAGDSNFNGSTSTASTVVVASSSFSLSLSGSSLGSIAPGSSAHTTITITPSGGLDPSTVTLGCSVSPVVSPAATCSVGATSVSGGTGSATLTVSTVGPHAALNHGSGGTLVALALLIPGLALCGVGASNGDRRKLLIICLAFLVLTGCIFQTACAGTSTGGSGSAGTPAGSYTVTVTGNAGGVQQTASATVSVQ